MCGEVRPLRGAALVLFLLASLARAQGDAGAQEPRADAPGAAAGLPTESPAAPDADLGNTELEWDLDETQTPEDRDPFEVVNRPIFGFNRFLDRVLFDPITRGYEWLVPGPGRRAVRRVFDNLNGPLVLVNDLLQLHPLRAGEAGARFVVNSTAGLVGIFDVADRVGLAAHFADFGQTLGRYGVGAGPYVVLPIMGPNTARDAVGSLVDSLFRPDTWLLSPGGRFLLTTGRGLSTKEAHWRDLNELERSSVDFYATMRLLYLEDRDVLVQRARDSQGGRDQPAGRSDHDEAPSA